MCYNSGVKVVDGVKPITIATDIENQWAGGPKTRRREMFSMFSWETSRVLFGLYFAVFVTLAILGLAIETRDGRVMRRLKWVWKMTLGVLTLLLVLFVSLPPKEEMGRRIAPGAWIINVRVGDGTIHPVKIRARAGEHPTFSPGLYFDRSMGVYVEVPPRPHPRH